MIIQSHEKSHRRLFGFANGRKSWEFVILHDYSCDELTKIPELDPTKKHFRSKSKSRGGGGANQGILYMEQKHLPQNLTHPWGIILHVGPERGRGYVVLAHLCRPALFGFNNLCNVI